MSSRNTKRSTKRRTKRAVKPRAPKHEYKASIRFPNESPAYRRARDRLLGAEVELRRCIEAVAAARRALPVGGKLAEDYAFDSVSGPVRLSQLFQPGKRSLLIYSFMYGPEMARACPSCTSILDALDGSVDHVNQQSTLVVVAKSPLPRILEHAKARGWHRLTLLSSANNTYNRDYHAEHPKWGQMPILNAFVKDGATVRHTWGTELLYAPTDPGQDGRHVDMIWPLWNLLDCTIDGRGTDWRPKLDYVGGKLGCCG